MSDADKCKGLVAWVDMMPGQGKRSTLYVLGTIMAPTPCHDPYAIYAGDEKTNPPTYMVQLQFLMRPDICPQVEADRELRYEQPNYAGNHKFLKLIFVDNSSRTVEIQLAS
jgi:hypothetical protein